MMMEDMRLRERYEEDIARRRAELEPLQHLRSRQLLQAKIAKLKTEFKKNELRREIAKIPDPRLPPMDSKELSGLIKRGKNAINVIQTLYKNERPEPPKPPGDDQPPEQEAMDCDEGEAVGEEVFEDEVGKDGIFRARKVRVHPMQEQKETLNLWFDGTRTIYNHCVDYVKTFGLKRFAKLSAAAQNRHLCDSVQKVMLNEEKYESFLDIPRDVRDDPVRDLIKAIKSTVTQREKEKLKKKKQGQSVSDDYEYGFNLGFRVKKYLKQHSIKISARNYNRPSGMFAFLKHLNDSHYEPDNTSKRNLQRCLPLEVDATITIHRTKNFDYFMTLLDRKQMNHWKPARDTISLDPGVRSMMTGYSNDGTSVSWGDGDMNRIFSILKYADELQSRMAQENCKKRRRMRKAWLRMLTRVRNMISEIHRKLCKWLVENYQVIFLPKFETSRMVRKADRILNNKTTRNMLTWGHYRFRELLKAKAALYPNVNVLICDEAYTSKTCSNCGHIHQKLGGSKTFKCPECKFEADRDVQGAKNIMLRTMRIKQLDFLPESPAVVSA